MRNQADRLLETFKNRDHSHATVELPDDLIPMFKRMMIWIRREEIARIEALREKTHHPELLETLDEKLKPLDELMNQQWLREAQPARIPPLTEYIPLQRVEELKETELSLYRYQIVLDFGPDRSIIGVPRKGYADEHCPHFQAISHPRILHRTSRKSPMA